MLVVCGLALWQGDRDVRLAGASLLIAWLGSSTAESYAQTGEPLYVVLVIDLALLVAFSVVTYRSDRWWPIAMTLLHATGIVGHITYLFEVKVSVAVYYTLIGVPSIGLLVALLTGTVGAWRERAATRRGAAAGLLAAS